MENEQNYMEKNVSRLVKLAGDPARPAKGFTDSLVDSALKELGRTGTGQVRTSSFLRDRLDRMMAVAAMLAVLGAAAIQVLLLALSWTSPLLASTLFITTSANWLSCVGRLIL